MKTRFLILPNGSRGLHATIVSTLIQNVGKKKEEKRVLSASILQRLDLKVPCCTYFHALIFNHGLEQQLTTKKSLMALQKTT